MSRLKTVRKIWATVGSILLVVFFLWMTIGYRPSAEAWAALEPDARVVVTAEDDYWSFLPAAESDRQLVFFPGALVDPRAYAPLMREVAEAGYPAFLISVPWRGAFGSADRPQVRGRARNLMASAGIDTWVVAGHSRGAKVASMLARDGAPGLAGLVVIGSTHPRDFSLAAIGIPVIKIYGSKDGVAPPDAVRANAHLLPESTKWVLIEGGNHGQFGYYGLQPLDHFADITRQAQQALTVAALQEALSVAAGGPGP